MNHLLGPCESGRRLLCGLRPEALTVAGEAGRALSFSVRVQKMELLGHEQIVHFTTDVPVLSQEMIDRVVAGTPSGEGEGRSGHLVARLSAATHLEREEAVQLTFQAGALTFFTSDGNALRGKT